VPRSRPSRLEGTHVTALQERPQPIGRPHHSTPGLRPQQRRQDSKVIPTQRGKCVLDDERGQVLRIGSITMTAPSFCNLSWLPLRPVLDPVSPVPALGV